MATSLALVAGAGLASAQAPKWESNAPSKTQWAPFPAPANAKAPAPPSEVPAVDALPPVGTRVVLFQKPAETQPKPVEPPKLSEQPKPGEQPKLGDSKRIPEPTRDQVFHMAGDPDSKGRPELPKSDTQQYQPRRAAMSPMPPMQRLLEPGYVVHRRLYFEDKNAERYGWSLGMTQPFVSAGYFFKDVVLWPSALSSNWRERYSTNAGKYLPGTPVPYYLYPPEITLLGYTLGAGAIVAVVFLLP